MSGARGCAMFVLIGFAALSVKCSYDKTMMPDRKKEVLLKQFPEIRCKRAEFSLIAEHDADTIIGIAADTNCFNDLRMALIERGYTRKSMNLPTHKEAFRSRRHQGSADYDTFQFNSDNNTIIWRQMWM